MLEVSAADPKVLDSQASISRAPDALTSSTQEWTLAMLVSGIQNGDPRAMTALYNRMIRGIRYFMMQRMAGRDDQVEDRVHEVFILTVEAIQAGKIRDPERLGGFVRTIAIRRAVTEVVEVGRERRRHADADVTDLALASVDATPEQEAISAERQQRMLLILKSLSERDREILRRFYLEEESQEQICLEMGLSETQFRLLKSRAKARFAERGKGTLKSRLSSAAAA